MLTLSSSSPLRREGEPGPSQPDRQHRPALWRQRGGERSETCSQALWSAPGCFLLKRLLFLADAFENARNLCDRYYMNSPELVLEEFNGDLKRLGVLGRRRRRRGSLRSSVCCHSGREGQARHGGLRPLPSVPHGV